MQLDRPLLHSHRAFEGLEHFNSRVDYQVAQDDFVDNLAISTLMGCD